jgi:hypothetical protein
VHGPIPLAPLLGRSGPGAAGDYPSVPPIVAAVLARVAPACVLALFPAPVALPPRLHDAVTARLDYLTVPGGRCPVAYWKGGRLKDSRETFRKFVAFEHPTSAGPILLTKTGVSWTVRYVGKAMDAGAHRTLPRRRQPSITPGFLSGTKSTNQCRRTSSTGARWASRFNLVSLNTGLTVCPWVISRRSASVVVSRCAPSRPRAAPGPTGTATPCYASQYGAQEKASVPCAGSIPSSRSDCHSHASGGAAPAAPDVDRQSSAQISGGHDHHGQPRHP